MTKPMRAGREIDAWCTKCKRIAGHRIVAMVGTTPARVQCEACDSQHNYKAHAPGEKPSSASSGAAAKGGAVRRAVGASFGARGSAAAGPRVTRAEQERRDREQQWEQAIAGKMATEFRRYDVKGTFTAGDLLRHTKFGDGVVTRVLDAKKIEVLFKDGDAKTLAQGI
jgi:translation initiation factor IF-1